MNIYPFDVENVMNMGISFENALAIPSREYLKSILERKILRDLRRWVIRNEWLNGTLV
jgi:hypothetical protein